MAQRFIDVMLNVGYGNGDVAEYKVMKLPIPDYLSSLKKEDKDDGLEQHAEWLKEWLRQAIERKQRDDEQSGIMDSW